MPNSPTPQRILAIKLADLGDLLLCEPALRSLRLAFPTTRIDVLTTPASIALLDLIGHDLRAIPFPKHIFDRPTALASPIAQLQAAKLALALRTARYDRVVVLHHLTTAYGARKFAALVRVTGSRYVAGLDNGRGTFLTHREMDRGFGEQHEAAYMRDVAVVAGGSDVDAAPSIRVPDGALLPPNLPSTFTAIFPGTGPFSRAREWQAQRYAELAIRLHHRGIATVLIGDDDASDAAATVRAGAPSSVDLTGKTTLQELAAVLSRARLVVGGDSFIGHLAAAVGTPVVSIFGPSNADAWRPAGALNWDGRCSPPGASLVVRHDLPCEPCIYTGFRLGRPAGCPDRTCLKRVTVDDVDAAVTRALGVA
ncbi:MAG: glycosyltransferase family 9 protein [Chloroflexota bacterium]|nr:glycosyltransferase family 9 protein [Chloroflexota bacterium]